MENGSTQVTDPIEVLADYLNHHFHVDLIGKEELQAWIGKKPAVTQEVLFTEAFAWEARHRSN